MKTRLIEYLRNAGKYNKAIAAASGGVATTLVALLGLGDAIPGVVSGYLVAGASVATSVAVFAVKNQARIEQLGNEGADLLE